METFFVPHGWNWDWASYAVQSQVRTRYQNVVLTKFTVWQNDESSCMYTLFTLVQHSLQELQVMPANDLFTSNTKAYTLQCLIGGLQNTMNFQSLQHKPLSVALRDYDTANCRLFTIAALDKAKDWQVTELMFAQGFRNCSTVSN